MTDHPTTDRVPREPTEAMLEGAREWSAKMYGRPIGNDAARGCYAAMLAATAPAPTPSPPSDSVRVPRVPTKAMLDVGFSAFLAAHDLMFVKNEPVGPIYKAMLSAAPAPAAGVTDETQSWRCFYCDDVFTTREAAYEHFGAETELNDTACQLTKDEKGLVGLLREAWDELRRYGDEDTKLMREVHGLGAECEREKREQEELGYARGLKDGRAEAALPHAADVREAVLEECAQVADDHARDATTYGNEEQQIAGKLIAEAIRALSSRPAMASQKDEQ